MNKKKLISLAALLAIMAFAVVPTAAQAAGNGSETHWQEGKIRTATGVKVPVIAWGTLELVSAAGNIQCRNAAFSNNTNTAGKEALSEVVMFATFECKATSGECTPPAEERATAFNLTPDSSPNKGVWASNNVEEGAVGAEETFRSFDLSEAGKTPVEVNIECYASGQKVGNAIFKTGGPNAFGKTGTSTPAILNGTTATKPSETSFDASSGHLQAAAENVEAVPVTGVAPTVNTVLGSKTIEDAGSATWPEVTNAETSAKEPIKPGCRTQSKVTLPTNIIKTIIDTKHIEMGNVTNGEAFSPAGATGAFPFEFRCGALVTVPIEGTTKGKVKFVGYKDNSSTPLITIASVNGG